MQTLTRHPLPIRFADFELDVRTGELSNGAGKVQLGKNPLQVLQMLLEQPGAIVTRDELHTRIWPGNTFVDFEDGLNHAVRKLREELGDSADRPRFIETVPRHGYRFIAPVVGTGEGTVAAMGTSPLQLRLVLAGGGLVVIAIVLVLFNVAGLRERLMTAVGAGSARSREGGALPYPKIESIAVLPLENLSGDPEQEYFADGMTEELITELGHSGAVHVISRTSVMRYKGTKKPLPEIARELNVDAIVEGAVLRSGDRVRITANLIHASTDSHLWAEAYERDLRDVLSLQSDIASAIGRQIQARLAPQEHAHRAPARPVDPEAFELYLKGNNELRRPDYPKALEDFQQAIEKDPHFARAHLGVAEYYRRLGHAVELGAGEAFGNARAFARKALDLDDSLAEAHVVVGDALWFGDWNWSGAEREYRRAVQVNPNSEFAHGALGRCLSLLARHDEALAEAKRVVEISPVRPGSYSWLMEASIRAGRYDQAFEQRQKILQLDPRADPLENTAWAYRGKGMYQEAIAVFLSIRGPYASSPPLLAHLGYTYALAGKMAEAERIIAKLVQRTAQDGVGAYEVAVVYAGLGDNGRALEWLEKAHQAREKGCAYLKVDFPFDPLRSDPHFQDLLRRMNFPP